MKTNQIRQSIVPAALVAAVAFSVWYGLDRPTPGGSSQPATAASATPSPTPVHDIATGDVPNDTMADVADGVPAVSEARKAIFSKPRNVTGQALKISGVEDFNIPPATMRGRTAELDAASFASLNDLEEGDAVSFPSFDGELHGVVEVAVIEENGWRRVGGPLEGEDRKSVV